MNNLENNYQRHDPLKNVSPEQNVKIEASGQLRINFDDENENEEAKDNDWVEKESKIPTQGMIIHLDNDEEEWENPEYTGEYIDYYKDR